MEVRDALLRGDELLAEFGLDDWRTVADNRPTRRFGQTRYRKKEIGLSSKIVVLNTPDRVEQTIRHEIAHALVGPGQGHNAVWKAKCLEVGAPPRACYVESETATPPTPWKLVCDRCSYEIARARRGNGRYGHRGCGGEMHYQRNAIDRI